MAVAERKPEIHVLKEDTDILSYARDIAAISSDEKGFIICDIGKIVQRYREWTNAMPRVTPYYAVKCNDHDIVLKTLSALGAGFDCSSKLEIDKVLQLGVETDRIVFAHTTKLISYIQHAAALNVSVMTFDNEQELYKIKKYYPDSKLLIRFRCDDLSALAILGKKFGCDHEIDGPQLLKIARELDLNVIGVNFHIGSGSKNPKIFQTAIRCARELFDLGPTYGYDFKLLDIGGGYPGDRASTLDEFANVINTALNEYFSDPEIRIIAEPGSFLVATSATLATNIHSLRTLKENGNMSLHNMYYINDGYYGTFNMLVTHGCVYNMEPLHKCKETALIKSSIWGPTCDSRDKILDTMLPQMNIGDWLIFHDVGDYSFKAASEFNGFPRADIHFVAKESIWILLRDTLPYTHDDFTMKKILPAEIK